VNTGYKLWLLTSSKFKQTDKNNEAVVCSCVAGAVYNVTSILQLNGYITFNVILLSYKCSWLENS